MADYSSILGTTSDLVLPPGVKATTDSQKGLYKAALEFERVFVNQMLDGMKKMSKVAGDSSDGSGEQGSDTSTDGYMGIAQDQMTQAVLDGGGLGLASIMYNQMSVNGTVDGDGNPVPDATDATTGADATAGSATVTSKAVADDVLTHQATAATPTAASDPVASAAVTVTPVADPATPTSTTSTTGATTPSTVATTGETVAVGSTGATGSDVVVAAPTTKGSATLAAQHHVRGFYKDQSSKTGWGFVNQYGNVAHDVHKPTAHNRVVTAGGTKTLGWGPQLLQHHHAAAKAAAAATTAAAKATTDTTATTTRVEGSAA